MPARAPAVAAAARPFRGAGVWLALVVVALQAPSISVHHCHDGGSEDHHHAVWQGDNQPAHPYAGDLAPSHGHRVVWGWDLHDPSGHDAEGEPGDAPCPAGVIQAGQSPAEAFQHRPVTCLPTLPGGLVARAWAPAEGNFLPSGYRIPACPHSGPRVLRV